MNDYMKVLGFSNDCRSGVYTKLYVINNEDGSPRWGWNAQNPHPDFLRFYAPTTLRSKAFSLLVKVIFLLKLQHLIFKRSSLHLKRDNTHALASFTRNHFAFFTGTPGPNRKLVLFAKQRFIKVALNEESEELVENEIRVLKQLKNGRWTEVPHAVKIEKGVISLTDVGIGGKRHDTFSTLHAEGLRELYSQFSTNTIIFGQSSIFQESLQYLQSIQAKPLGRIPKFLLQKLFVLAHSLEEQQLTFTWAHRDFTPWNCCLVNEKICLYDFELAHQQLPFGFDAFHFVMQQGVLVNRLSWQKIKPQLKAAFDKLRRINSCPAGSFETNLQAYLFININYYLNLYSQQDVWHEQIHWLMNTWNDALSDQLPLGESRRSLLIGDVFDFLHNKKYATVKFPSIDPKALSLDADIDILTEKKIALGLRRYLSMHSLVAKLSWQPQSNMLSLMVVLNSGELLSLDLIWCLKRKALAFMDVEQAVSDSIVNDFGVKCLNPINTREYIGHFYHLNGSTVPEKYLPYFTGSFGEVSLPVDLLERVRSLPINTGFSGWLNYWDYLKDSLRRLFFSRGIIVTFSGVDGAGKSTIIEHTKALVEKRLRKKVVVIRHRPSLLPILSAITKGREEAERKAAISLPRQGKNKNLLSSLLRFSYYYLDYLFGQFYVHGKYLLRGDIVLYDRYYFDFINDSMRSNIRLPKWLTKAGYHLLLKPDLNFFLYADVETILGRKMELNESAIVELTSDYLSLFAELEGSSGGRYFSLENIFLEDSLEFITAKIQSKVY